jgi:lipopolysaccharide export system permease protein
VLSRFGELAAGCLFVLVIAFLLVDVIDNLQWFTKYHSTLDEVLRFYAARLPMIASRVVPMALLVAAALTVSLLGVTGELLGMRTCGIPALRIVLPILMLCCAVGGVYFALVDQIVPHATAEASHIKRIEIKHRTTEQVSVWAREGDVLCQLERIDPLRGVASGLTLYEIDPDGLPRSRTDADEARYVGGGAWQLSDPRRIEVQGESPKQVPASALAKLGEDLARERDGSQLSIGELRQEIREMEDRGNDTTAFRVDLHAKLAAPLACIVLPALALLFASGGPPFPKPSHILVLSVAVGIGYMLLSAVGVSLGYGGAVGPAVAGWGPIAALALVTLWLAARVRRLARGA